LLPTIANIIKRPLHKYGVSIVNVGSTAFIRYCKIFLRKDNLKLNIPVAIITDIDIRPIEYYKAQAEKYVFVISQENIESINKLSPGSDFEKLINQVFTSTTAFNDVINIHKKGRLLKSNRERIHQICKVQLSEEIIVKLRTQKKETLMELYNLEKNKVFISNNWTLEYELALSSIKKELNKAIIMATSEV
jgi:putative ATP-dependent endonuclease of OLD family